MLFQQLDRYSIMTRTANNARRCRAARATDGARMPDGSPAELGATTAEVARRQPDGTWLYVIDNAWGDQAAA